MQEWLRKHTAVHALEETACRQDTASNTHHDKHQEYVPN